MSSTVSSPFVENYEGDHTEVNLRQTISHLRFQLESAQTEKRLLEASQHGSSAELERLLSQKNSDLSTLQENFDFVYQQRAQLQTKLENQLQIASSTIEDLQKQLKQYKSETRKAMDEARKQHTDYSRTKDAYEKSRSKLASEIEVTSQLHSRILDLESQNQDLCSQNESLVDRLTSLNQHIQSNSQSQLVRDLTNNNESLEKTVSQLQLKVDQLLQNKTSVELLRQKNLSQMNKITDLEKYKEQANSLEIQNLELRAKYDGLMSSFSDSISHHPLESSETVVANFIKNFKELQATNLALYDKYNLLHAELKDSKAFEEQVNSEVLPQITRLESSIEEKVKIIAELQKQKVLNGKEIGFLRELLKKFDQIQARGEENSSPTRATEEYLSRLEKLVDDYKTEIEVLHNSKIHQQAISSEPALKKRRSENSTLIIDKLEKENLRFLSRIKALENDVRILNQNNEHLQNIASKKQDLRILQLKLNPASKDQAIKQLTLDALRKENEDLIAAYINRAEASVPLIPRAVFARQEHDKQQLQTKVDNLLKKNTRLRDIYGSKSRDILTMISKYFGYNLEFVPSPTSPDDLSSRVKFTSRYLANKQISGHLILDINTKSLRANGNNEFKNLCEDLVTDWVNEKGQIPCFLSALNLKIYEEYVRERF